VVFVAAVIGLQWITVSGGYRVGRRLETRMRMAFLAKIPRLPDGVIDRIIDRFGNLQKIMRATIDDLDDVEGVGDTRAKTIKEGLESTPGVTATRGMAWIVEGKLNYRNDPKFKDQDPGLFKMYAVPLPKN